VIVNLPAAPGIQSFGLTNGRVSLVITGPYNPDYKIQTSTNLALAGGWTTVFTTNSPILPLRWTDSNPLNFSKRFYRVQLGP
jgi:hypothetical protein